MGIKPSTLASEALNYFKLDKQNDGTEFWALRNDAPDWVKEMALTALARNGEIVPDRWTWQLMVYVLEDIGWQSYVQDINEIKDDVDFHIRFLPEVFLQWLGSLPHRVEYVNQIIKEDGLPERGIWQAIEMAIQREIHEIFNVVVSAIQKEIQRREKNEPC